MIYMIMIQCMLTKEVLISPKTLPQVNLARLTYGTKDVLRLIDPSNIVDYDEQDIWNISGEKFKFTLVKDGSHICGKKSDPGVIPCVYQDYKINFVAIKKDGSPNNVYFQTDDNLCLTIAGFDQSTKGFYINLKMCIMSDSQLFLIKDLNNLNEHDEDSLPIVTNSKLDTAKELFLRSKIHDSDHLNPAFKNHQSHDLDKKHHNQKLSIMEEHDIWLQHEKKFNSDDKLSNNTSKFLNNKLHHEKNHHVHHA